MLHLPPRLRMVQSPVGRAWTTSCSRSIGTALQWPVVPWLSRILTILAAAFGGSRAIILTAAGENRKLHLVTAAMLQNKRSVPRRTTFEVDASYCNVGWLDEAIGSFMSIVPAKGKL